MPGYGPFRADNLPPFFAPAYPGQERNYPPDQEEEEILADFPNAFRLDLPMDKALEWVYRVKKWHVAGSITANILSEYSDGSSHESTMTCAFDGDLENLAEDERDQLFRVTSPLTEEPFGHEITVAANVHIVDVPPPGSGGETEIVDNETDFLIGFYLLADPYEAQVTNAACWLPSPNAGHVRPCIYVSIGGATLSTETDSRQAATAHSYTATIDGETLNIYVRREIDESTDTFSAGGSLTITPVEWWPFANRDGDPIYNTATGEVIPENWR